MREGLEEDLRKYNDIAKRNIEFNETGPSRQEKHVYQEQLDSELDQMFSSITAEAVRGRPISKKAAERVYQLQLQKQQIMRQLHQDLRKVDEGTYESESNSRYWVSGDVGNLEVALSRNEKTQITMGDIIAGEDWGIDFHIDTLECSRQVVKRWLVERAKNQMRHLLNSQLEMDARARGQISDADAIKAVVDHEPFIQKKLKQKNLELNTQELGIFTEKFVRNFMVKTCVDCDLDFEVLDTDAEEDTKKRLDLIVYKRRHTRGVRTEYSAEAAGKYGLQITISQRPENLEGKRMDVNQTRRELRQGGSLQDLALVKISPELTGQIGERIEKWSIKKGPKGPDAKMSLALKEQLFKELLQGMFTKEELDEQWAKVVGESGGKESRREEVEGVEPILSDRSEAHPILPEIIGHAEAAD